MRRSVKVILILWLAGIGFSETVRLYQEIFGLRQSFLHSIPKRKPSCFEASGGLQAVTHVGEEDR